MNNEDKRFKQINRIAAPIQVNPNANPNTLIQQTIDNSKKTVVVKHKEKKEVNYNLLLLIISIVFFLVDGGLLVYLIIPANSNLHYNDVSNNNTLEQTFTDIYLSDEKYLEKGITYRVNEDFSLKQDNNTLLVNDIKTVASDFVLSNVALIDDLILVVTQNTELRSKSLYIFDKEGKLIKEYYDFGDNFTISDEDDAIVITPTDIIIKTTNVNLDRFYTGNKKGNLESISVCDASLNDPNRSVWSNYSLTYKSNHEFNEVKETPMMSIDEYRKINNYCNQVG